MRSTVAAFLAAAFLVPALPAAAAQWPKEAERVVEGLKFTEGPAWHPDGYLLFSDIPADRIYRWAEGKELAVYRQPSHQANGLAIDPKGRLVACEHGARRVTRTEPDGTVVVLAERYQGKRLNSPNDLALHSDGSIYFTDPPYGVRGRERELDFQGVYRVAPDGGLTLLADDLPRPNGIGLSPDEKRLYVDDSQRKIVRVHPLRDDGSVGRGRLLIDLGKHGTRVLDGMAVDVQGNLYVTGTDGVFVVSPEGELLATIPCPGQCTNCCFGGEERRTLYVTARTKQGGSVYRVAAPIAGHQVR
ncbi:MAG: SMP-30/gluconolactonase/LRE family protein [Candidatus Brocadiia bacterium]